MTAEWATLVLFLAFFVPAAIFNVLAFRTFHQREVAAGRHKCSGGFVMKHGSAA